MEMLAAFGMGLVGSLHCIGMCGPIALALPGAGAGPLRMVGGRLVYNAGRIITYVLLGAVFGFIGSGINLSGAQQGISIVVGVACILAVSLPYRLRRKLLPAVSAVPGMQLLRTATARLFRSDSMAALLLIGLLNGLLPCGFVYVALAAALLLTSTAAGMAYMAMFGLGTVPLMLMTSLAGNVLGLRFRSAVYRAMPLMLVVLGLLFILRGLALDIPYLSPVLAAEPADAACCH